MLLHICIFFRDLLLSEKKLQEASIILSHGKVYIGKKVWKDK